MNNRVWAAIRSIQEINYHENAIKEAENQRKYWQRNLVGWMKQLTKEETATVELEIAKYKINVPREQEIIEEPEDDG